jgi:hypothetical protein
MTSTSIFGWTALVGATNGSTLNVPSRFPIIGLLVFMGRQTKKQKKRQPKNKRTKERKKKREKRDMNLKMLLRVPKELSGRNSPSVIQISPKDSVCNSDSILSNSFCPKESSF